MSTAETEIRQLLATYFGSLNESDAATAAASYTSDGVFMPTTLPTASGTEMKAAYEQVFAAIRLNVILTIDEVVVASDDIAYALTHSTGTVTVLADGTENPEANREIFVFRREDGAWKIARYMFNKSQ